MPKIQYIEMEKGFRQKSLDIIELANEIIEDYEGQGYDLTLRQLYYQMVSRDIIPNNSKSYDNLGSLVNNARLMGLIDWDAITDRTRNLRGNTHWNSPQEIIDAAARSFMLDRRRDQQYRVEVWVEKDALVGVVGTICQRLDVPYFACRGYTSQSEMWAAAQRLGHYVRSNQEPVILHLGDHDPSGIDMSRDIEERLNMFINHDLEEDWLRPDCWHGGIIFERLALNWDQIQLYNPPPNPAKLTDSRGFGYVERFGESSWELDALSPSQISSLIETAVDGYTDDEIMNRYVLMENRERVNLTKVARQWKNIDKLFDSLEKGDQK